MRLTKLLTVIVLCTVVGAAWFAQPKAMGAPLDLKGKTLKQVFDELLPGMAAKDQAARHGPQQQWQHICFQAGAPGNEAAREEACKLMIEKLGAETPNPARTWLLKQLERLGRGESVNAVAAVLDDKDDLVHDAAVRCLTNNPAPEAAAKLVAKLPAASGKVKVGLLNALGYRADKAAGEAVAKELASADAVVAVAAARTLGKIATPEAVKALAAARAKTQGQAHFWICDAYLSCADRRLKEGKTAEAAAIYQELYKAEESRPLRLAALLGVLKSAGDPAGPMILDVLGGDDADARAIAIGQIENLSPGAIKPLAANLDKLPAASQVLVLNMIAARGDKSQLPVALTAVKNTDGSIKRAGFQALGRLGDASVVGMLIEAMHAGGNLGSVAADSLAQLAADGVNEKLLAALAEEKMPNRIVALIGILELRKAVTAVPVLLKAALSNDAAVRMSAFTGLRTLAEPKHVPDMVRALLKIESGKERAQAELAIVAVGNQIVEPEKRAEPILAFVTEEATAPSLPRAQQAALLPLLGRFGGARALQVMKKALGNPELYEAALAGLCNWPDPLVSDDLLKLAQGAKEQNQRLQTLQAAIHINATQPTDRPNQDRLSSLTVLKKAMELATRDQERKAILEGLGTVRHIDSLRFVLPYLDNKDLAQSACKGIVELAHSKTLREPNQAEFNKALDRVIPICKDKALIERAKQYKQ